MQLTEANEIVSEEIHRLEHNADTAFETVNARFQSVLDEVERQRQIVLEDVKKTRDEKRKVRGLFHRVFQPHLSVLLYICWVHLALNAN